MIPTNERSPVLVLIVDDIENDRFLFGRALRKSAPCLTVVGEASNGEEAIAYLSGQDEFANRERYPFPGLLFLDLEMPRVNGWQVLAWLKTQDFPQLKIAVFSAWMDEQTREMALASGAHYAFIKVFGYPEFLKLFVRGSS